MTEARERNDGHIQLVAQCDCQDSPHMVTFIFTTYKGQEPALYVSVQLNQQHSWYKRLWIATQYLLGRRSHFTYSHWDAGRISLWIRERNNHGVGGTDDA